jgi:hypothetical protein
MSHRRLVSVLAIALCGAGAWWWFFHWQVPEMRSESTQTPPSADDRPTPVLDPVPHVVPASEPRADDSDRSASRVAPTPRLHLRGSVVSLDDGWGLHQARVEFRSLREGPELRATEDTNVHGGFEFVLDGSAFALGEFARAKVLDQDGALRFDGLVRIEQDVELRVHAALALRGSVVVHSDCPSTEVRVTIATPARRVAEFPQPLGRVTAGVGGAFELRAALDEPGTELLAAVEFECPPGHPIHAGADVSLATLASDSGAQIDVFVSVLRMRIVDERGNPIGDAVASAASATWSPPRFLESARSAGDGALELAVASGPVLLWLHAPDHASRLERIDADESLVELEIALRRLEGRDRIFGVVALDDGRPVEGADVVFAPRLAARSVVPLALLNVNTDARGEFQTLLAGNQEFELFARHSRYGQSRRFAVQHDGSTHFLRVQPAGKLRVDLATDALPGPFRSGNVEFVVVSADGFEREQGLRRSLPFDVGPLSPGDYEVFALVPGFDACAAGRGHVSSGERTEVQLSARAASWVVGQVVDARGAPLAGLRVVAVIEGWRAAEDISTAITDAAGRFRVFSPTLEPRLNVYDSDGLLATRRASVGPLAVLVVD